MRGNSFGKLLSMTSYGESHGDSIGVVLDGIPAGLDVNIEDLQKLLDARRPGRLKESTNRNEADKAIILSGVFENKTLGTPISIQVKNTNQRSKDYSKLKNQYRPGHADRTTELKFGIRDYRGGGRASGRETIARVIGGYFASLIIPEVKAISFITEVGPFKANENDILNPGPGKLGFANRLIEDKISDYLLELKEKGDSMGGRVRIKINNVPVGLGEPLFNKLNAAIGQAMLSINAVKGFEFGSGFAGVSMRGSEHNDSIENVDGKIKTTSNHSGLIQGGISNGEDIYFNVAFKPVATIMQDQASIDKDGNSATVQGKGRHDPCVVPRAVPIVEAMSAIVMIDFYLLAQTN